MYIRLSRTFTNYVRIFDAYNARLNNSYSTTVLCVHNVSYGEYPAAFSVLPWLTWSSFHLHISLLRRVGNPRLPEPCTKSTIGPTASWNGLMCWLSEPHFKCKLTTERSGNFLPKPWGPSSRCLCALPLSTSGQGQLQTRTKTTASCMYLYWLISYTRSHSLRWASSQL